MFERKTMPGKQILTNDRRIGMEFSKVAYGYAVDDVTMTFYALNDYGIKKYLDNWTSTILDEENQTVAYKNEYQRDIRIHQLRKPIINKKISDHHIPIEASSTALNYILKKI